MDKFRKEMINIKLLELEYLSKNYGVEELLETFNEDNIENKKAKKIKDACDKYIRLRVILDIDRVSCQELGFNEDISFIVNANGENKDFFDIDFEKFRTGRLRQFGRGGAASVYEIVSQRVAGVEGKKRFQNTIQYLREQIEKFQELRTHKEEYAKISQEANEKIKALVGNRDLKEIAKFAANKAHSLNNKNFEFNDAVNKDNSELEKCLRKMKIFLSIEKPSDENIDDMFAIQQKK